VRRKIKVFSFNNGMLRQVQSDRSNLAHGWLPFAADSIRQQFGIATERRRECAMLLSGAAGLAVHRSRADLEAADEEAEHRAPRGVGVTVT